MHIAMYTPWRVRCGISDYSRLLVEAMRTLPEVADLRLVEAPEASARGGLASLLRFAGEERRFYALGAELNQKSGVATDVAHIQHQYFFFGGVAPHKNHAHAFLNALRIPVVMTVHEIACPPDAGTGNRDPGETGTPFVVQQAVAITNRANFLHPAIRALIVHTGRDREALLAMGASPDRVHILLHPTPPAAPMPSRPEAQRALGLEGCRVVTLFGFLATKKGHTLALEMMRYLPEEVVVLFAGGQHPQDHTDYVPGLRARIAAEALAGRVRITDYLAEDEIPTVMAATDVAIAPFVQSSGSGSLANLFAYGRAIVASDIPPHREIVLANPSPRTPLALFPSGDARALAASVRRLLEAEPQRTALQQAALDYALRHSYLEMARATASLYRDIL